MEVMMTIPDAVLPTLQSGYGKDVGRAAVERLALDGYNSGKLSRYQVQLLLGFDNRWDTENWLGDHGATWNYGLDDLEADRRTIEKYLGPMPS